MTTLQITSTKSSDSVNTSDGMTHRFTRSKIDYTVLIQKDCVNVWKRNSQRGGSLSNDCFWNGVNNRGQSMPKFLKTAINLIKY